MDDLKARITAAKERLSPRRPADSERDTTLATIPLGLGDELRISYFVPHRPKQPVLTLRVWRSGWPMRNAGFFLRPVQVPDLVAALADAMERLPAPTTEEARQPDREESR